MVTAVKFKEDIFGVCIFFIVVDKFRHSKTPSHNDLFIIHKYSEVSFNDIV